MKKGQEGIVVDENNNSWQPGRLEKENIILGKIAKKISLWEMVYSSFSSDLAFNAVILWFEI